MLCLDDPEFFNRFAAFNFTQAVNELCKPLFAAINANYFDYNRIYKNNLFLCLTTDGEWVEKFFRKKYKLGSAFEQSGKHLWDSFFYQEAIADAKLNFNHSHGISIFFQRENYIEYIDIAAAKENNKITSTYLNNFNLIENFIADFSKAADKLIALPETNLVTLPKEICVATSEEQLIYKHNFRNPIQLSQREQQCLELFLQGKTAKETAEFLSLSNRTVEEYLNNVKQKLKCRNKRDLLTIFYPRNGFK